MPQVTPLTFLSGTARVFYQIGWETLRSCIDRRKVDVSNRLLSVCIVLLKPNRTAALDISGLGRACWDIHRVASGRGSPSVMAAITDREAKIREIMKRLRVRQQRIPRSLCWGFAESGVDSRQRFRR